MLRHLLAKPVAWRRARAHAALRPLLSSEMRKQVVLEERKLSILPEARVMNDVTYRC